MNLMQQLHTYKQLNEERLLPVHGFFVKFGGTSSIVNK